MPKYALNMQNVYRLLEKTKTSLKDWIKMEFMRDDNHEFIDVLSSYKSTISVGFGTLTMFVKPFFLFYFDGRKLTNTVLAILLKHLEKFLKIITK